VSGLNHDNLSVLGITADNVQGCANCGWSAGWFEGKEQPPRSFLFPGQGCSATGLLMFVLETTCVCSGVSIGRSLHELTSSSAGRVPGAGQLVVSRLYDLPSSVPHLKVLRVKELL
jgi:hypothetical protein